MAKTSPRVNPASSSPRDQAKITGAKIARARARARARNKGRAPRLRSQPRKRTTIFFPDSYLLALAEEAAQNPGIYPLNRQKPIPEKVTGLALGPGGDGGAVGTSGQVTGSLWDVADVDTGPMGQPIGNEVEPAKVKAKGKGKPVTAEDTDSALASFAGQELGRRSGQVRRRRTGSVIPRPHLPSVALRPEPPAPVVPDWFVRRIRPPKLPRPRRP